MDSGMDATLDSGSDSASDAGPADSYVADSTVDVGPAFFNDAPDWSEPFAISLDLSTWTPELTASTEGTGEFELLNASPANLTVKTDDAGRGALYIYPGLSTSYAIGPGQAVVQLPENGSEHPALPEAGTVASMPGAIDSGDLSNVEILGCGRTDLNSASEKDCSVDWSQPYYAFDLGDACTDNGSAYGGSVNGCVLSSGFYGPGGYYTIMAPVTSARISTKFAKQFKYGRLEIRAKLPRGDWLWPAIWMLPANQTGAIEPDNPAGTGRYGGWPRSGEIDIMESRGNSRACSEAYERRQPDGSPLTAVGGVQSFASTLHWGPYFNLDEYAGTHTEYSVPESSRTLDQDFHIYGLRWNSTGLYTYIDDDSHHVLEVSFRTQSFYQRVTADAGILHCLETTSESDGGTRCVTQVTYSPDASNWDDAAPMDASYEPVEQLWADAGAEGGAPNAAPFDQPFYLVIDVAVGDTVGGYFPDGWCGKPWEAGAAYPVGDFYAANGQWFYPGIPLDSGPNNPWSLDGGDVSDDTALQIEEIRYWEDSNPSSPLPLSSSAVQ
jgi:beta-glucanase (GH16 family)